MPFNLPDFANALLAGPRLCSAGHNHEDLRESSAWYSLELVGHQADDVETLELRNCACRSTLCRPVVRCSGCVAHAPATRRDAFDVADVCDFCGEDSDRQHAEMDRREKRLAAMELI